MGGSLHGAGYFEYGISICLREYRYSLYHFIGNPVKFIHVLAALETENTDQRSVAVLFHDGNGEFPALFNTSVRVVVVVDADSDSRRI